MTLPRLRNLPEFRTMTEHPRVRALRDRLAAHPEVGGKRADLFIERMLLGFLHQVGDGYLGEMSRRLDQLIEVRGELSHAFESVLSGEAVSPDRVRKLFGDLEDHLNAIESPTQRIEKHGGPHVPAGLPTNVPLVSSGALRLALRDLMPHFERLSRDVQDAITRAAERYPELIGKIVRSETTEGFTRNIDELATLLHKDGVLDLPTQRRISEGLKQLNEIFQGVRRADEALTLFARAHELPPGLRGEVLANPRLLQMARSPEHLIALWRAFKAKPRDYPFARYVWFIQHHVRGNLGEFEAAFRLGNDFIILKGPDAQVTLRGTDLVVVNRRTGAVHLIDNKAFTSAETVNAVSSLTKNLPRNLFEDMHALAGTALAHEGALEVAGALRKMEAAWKDLAALGITSTSAPGQQALIASVLARHGITREVSNAAGSVNAISQALQTAGIDLRNVNY